MTTEKRHVSESPLFWVDEDARVLCYECTRARDASLAACPETYAMLRSTMSVNDGPEPMIADCGHVVLVEGCTND